MILRSFSIIQKNFFAIVICPRSLAVWRNVNKFAFAYFSNLNMFPLRTQWAENWHTFVQKSTSS